LVAEIFVRLPGIYFAIILAFSFAFIFGRSWQEGAGLVIALAPWTIAALIVSPLSRVLLITQNLERKFAYDIFALLSACAALYWARAMALSLTSAIALLSAARVLGYVIYFYVLLRSVHYIPSSLATVTSLDLDGDPRSDQQ